MFGCCCVNKKALKKEQRAIAVEGNGKATEESVHGNREDAKPFNSIKSPQNTSATDTASYKSPTRNDKSNSSDEDNNLSGLIMSDGLVGEGHSRLIQHGQSRSLSCFKDTN